MSNEIVKEVHSLLARRGSADLEGAEQDGIERQLERKFDSLVLDVLAADHDRAFTEQQLKVALLALDLEVGVKDLFYALNRLTDANLIRRVKGLRYSAIHPDVLDRQLADTPPPPRV